MEADVIFMLLVSQCGKIALAQDHTNFSDNKHPKEKKNPFFDFEIPS